MQATVPAHNIAAPSKPRLAGTRATLAALGTALLALIGIHEY